MRAAYLLVLCVVIVVIIVTVITRRVETYADYMETWGKPMYNLVPTEFNVFLINLDTKPERLDNFIDAYKRTDLFAVKKFERVAAVNGRQLDLSKYVSEKGMHDIEMIEQRGYRIKHNQLTRGAVGCYLSHMKIYKMIRDRPENYGIIFEDDVKFNQREVYKHLRIEMARIPDDWDVLLMGCVCHVCKNQDGYKDLDHFFLLHAYVVRKSGAAKILNEIEYLPVRQQIDSELSVLATQQKIKVYCLTKPLVWQDPRINATTIQTPLKILPGVNPYSLA